MLFSTHLITGATVGVLSGNPFFAFIFAWFSHHILDSLPHFDQGSFYMKADRGPTWSGADYSDTPKTRFGNKRDWIILFFDFFVGGCLFLYLLYAVPIELWWLLLVGGFAGILPDVLDGSPFWKKKFRKTRFGRALHKLHEFLHWPLSVKFWPIGLGLQVLILAIALFLIT